LDESVAFKISTEALQYMELYPIVRIIGKKTYNNRGIPIRPKGTLYRVEGIDSKTNKMRILNMSDFELSDKASQEEIEKYEFMKSTIKYNL